MDTSLQNMSTSDLEQYVLARYLRTTAEEGLISNPLTEGEGRSVRLGLGGLIDGRAPFDGNYFISALASVDSAKGT